MRIIGLVSAFLVLALPFVLIAVARVSHRENRSMAEDFHRDEDVLAKPGLGIGLGAGGSGHGA